MLLNILIPVYDWLFIFQRRDKGDNTFYRDTDQCHYAGGRGPLNWHCTALWVKLTHVTTKLKADTTLNVPICHQGLEAPLASISSLDTKIQTAESSLIWSFWNLVEWAATKDLLSCFLHVEHLIFPIVHWSGRYLDLALLHFAGINDHHK